MHTIIIPTIMTVVLTGESGENRQETIIPVPAPEKKSTTDFSCLFFPLLFLYLLIVSFWNPPLIKYQDKTYQAPSNR